MWELEALEAREQQQHARKDALQQRDSQGNLIQAKSQPAPQQEPQEKLDNQQGNGRGRGGRGRGRGGRGRRGRGGRQQRQEEQGQQQQMQGQGQGQVQRQQKQGQAQRAQGQQSQGKGSDENLPTPPAVSGQSKQEFGMYSTQHGCPLHQSNVDAAGASGHEEAPSKVQDTKVPVRSVGAESEFFYDVDEQVCEYTISALLSCYSVSASRRVLCLI